MKTWLSTVLLLLIHSLAPAQNPATWVVEGYISTEKGEALPGAQVTIDDTVSTIAGVTGFYRLQYNRRPTVVTARRLGYTTQQVPLDGKVFRGNTLRLDIVLSDQNIPLQEVDIAAKKIRELAKEDFLSQIFDYDFLGDSLLLLIRERKKHFIRLVSGSGEVVDEMELPGRPTLLVHSCTGRFHLAGSAFAQELLVQEAGLDTFPRYALSEFRSMVEPCVLESRGYYFFRKMGRFNQSVRYWYRDPSGEWHTFLQISRDGATREMRYALDSMAAGASMVLQPNLPPNWRGQPYDMGFDRERAVVQGDFDTQHLLAMADYNSQISHIGWLESLRMDSVYAPLIRQGDTLLLFDHEHDAVLRFEAGFSAMETLPIYYHHSAGWQKALLQDAITGDIYAHFSTPSGHVLKKLHPETFAIQAVYPLPEVTYLAHQFKIRDRYLYFLGQPNVNIPNTSLYKVDIR